jgi:nicotinamide phosphoribosyltransferase
MSKFFNPSFAKALTLLLNPVFHTDSYKVSHKAMEVDQTQLIYSNFTPRSSKYFEDMYPNFDKKVVFFGLQYFILKELVHNWQEHFFSRDHDEVMSQIEEIFLPYIGMSGDKLKHFSDLHKLGYLPLHVKALDEGTLVPVGMPVLTVQNTHPDHSWLTNYIESVLSAEMWKPITIATSAREFAKIRNKYYDLTVSDHTFKGFAIHDFSYRGHSSHDSAAICGAAALLYSIGTDNVPGLVLARTIYGADNQVAFSVAASEHSVTTLGINFFATQVLADPELIKLAEQLKAKLKEIGAEDEYEQALGELVTLHRLLTKVYPTGVLSYVADSYDFWRVLLVLLPLLKPYILARTEGKLVIRPDSGDPVDIVVGESRHGADAKVNPDSPEWKGAIEVLAEVFGTTTNDKGYKELIPQIGLIYGDGITMKRAIGIYDGLMAKGYAASNVVLGVGSYSFAGGTRDSLGMAIKATAAMVDDQSVALYKAPKTDDGTKKSAKGFIVINRDNKGDLVMKDQVEYMEESQGELRTVFLNGMTPYLQQFDEIRELANK